MNEKNLLIEKYFEEHPVTESNINSFNTFIDVELQKIIKEELGEIIPTIIPPKVQDFRIKFGRIQIGKPVIIEADGSKKEITPAEARIRKLTYSASITAEVSTYVDDVQKETYSTVIGKIPIMVMSNRCHLNGSGREELIKRNEDPDDPGGYFIINGNERVLITVEDLASNKLFIQENKTGPIKFTGKLFSQSGVYRILHTLEQMKDGVIYLSFSRFQKVPFITIIKALGLLNDQEITQMISPEKQYDDIYMNLINSVEIKTQDDALESLSKKINIAQPKEVKMEKTMENIDKFLLPHLGIDELSRKNKAYNLCKLVKKYLAVVRGDAKPTNKDHYASKRLRLSGDLLSDLFRTNVIILRNDILYNFQRLVKRGKFYSTKIIIREKLLTQRVKSAMATGNWTGGRKGVSQNADRINFLSLQSHLQRITSLLSSSQENFEAREIHSTHFGRFCPIETPEGTPIGLRKNLTLLANVSDGKIDDQEKMFKIFERSGMKQKND